MKVRINCHEREPSHLDAIRALSGSVEDANQSIAKTNAALGLAAALI